MEAYKLQIIETIIALIAFALMRYLTQTVINNTLKNTSIQKGRRKFVVKLINLISGISLLIIVGAIWGLNQNKIALFLGSILAVLGVAFFAQWSLLSNITAGLILFFHHPAKIGDRIKILDKDFPFDGEIMDMSYFFVKIKTVDNEIVLIPNSLLLQKSVAVNE
jgi:small-conductance mechanosensitive channel